MACGSGDGEPATAEGFAEEYGGATNAYERVLTLTDCAELQEEFDTAFERSETSEASTDHHKAAVGFMEAADARMSEVGCYE